MTHGGQDERRSFRALQIVGEPSGADRATFKIDTADGVVLIHMDRLVLKQFFHQTNWLRMELQKTPERFEEI
jgi:hypothetical protein